MATRRGMGINTSFSRYSWGWRLRQENRLVDEEERRGRDKLKER